ncbi:pyrroloquinoline quinone biosynthesis protein PqqE [Paracoccus suum]|uniref:PqqA peptide cyclase n=1 Tax=Paracoccus suum TaxID=2259340 RepID=A0A344PLR3_9RHOB|nr:pyrroloquinoline quinone biosynthesis protein PqqE [Paracoccus suum]AXC50318.1 pyrroloquinoline quinone biosynthesis protein PqqE [Paracoccus suum]
MDVISTQPCDIDGNRVAVRPPMAMLAEITHRCPLACPYCSNPLQLSAASTEINANTWMRVFREAAAIGVLQVHISGGEPASRRDLEEICAGAREAGLYVNLITSGVGLTEARVRALDAAGVDHVQLSVQGVNAAMSDWIGGYRGGFARKMQAAEWIVAAGLPLTLNAVVHRQNIDDLPQAIAMAEALGARRIEVATVQFHGWAELNRPMLMPTEAQARTAREVVDAARVRLRGRMVVDYVPADHHARYPKACMGGWGSTGLNVTPDGTVLPCHAAQTIPHLSFPNVREASLAEIWEQSPAFNAYRGTGWMAEPCASCPRKEVDFGGCRCQAMRLAGDARATDPVCILSPLHAELAARVAAEVAAPEVSGFTWRRMPRPVREDA